MFDGTDSEFLHVVLIYISGLLNNCSRSVSVVQRLDLGEQSLPLYYIEYKYHVAMLKPDSNNNYIIIYNEKALNLDQRCSCVGESCGIRQSIKDVPSGAKKEVLYNILSSLYFAMKNNKPKPN